MHKPMGTTCDRRCKKGYHRRTKEWSILLGEREWPFGHFDSSKIPGVPLKRTSDAAKMGVIKLKLRRYRIMSKIGYSVSSPELCPFPYPGELIVCKMLISIKKIKTNISFLVSLPDTPIVSSPLCFISLTEHRKVNFSSDWLMAMFTSEGSQ